MLMADSWRVFKIWLKKYIPDRRSIFVMEKNDANYTFILWLFMQLASYKNKTPGS